MTDHAIRSERAAGLRVDALRSAIVLCGFAVTLGGLHTILEGFAWWVLGTVLCGIVLGVGVVVRSLLPARSFPARALAPGAALFAVAVVMMLRFGWGTGYFGVIPNAQTVERFGTLVRDAGYSITWQTVPATADEPISFVFALGVAALAIVAEIVVFSLRLPALVGFPLAAIFLLPGLTPEGRTDGWFFAASAMAFLAILVVGRRWQAGSALAVGAVAVVGGLLLPAVLPSTDFTVTSSGLGPSVSTGVNPILRLGEDLRENEERIALTYSTVSGDAEYLRLTEISDFSGQSWGPDQPTLDPQNRPVALPRAPGLKVGITTVREVTYVHVANLVSPWLPVPYATSSVTGLKGSWQFLPESFTIASNVDLARGEDYTVSSERIAPTPQQLLSADARVPGELERYLSLPATVPATIENTAKNVTANASGPYKKALAVQEFLRSAPFRYSETAPETEGYDGTGVDYIAAFLEEKRGYCIHFASAMAVMARELGIPSRIIVGFQPGALQNGDDGGRRLFAVTNKDLHAWPELYFGGIGWVRFEPTPSRGSVPDYANQAAPDVPPVSGANSDGSPSSGLDPSLDSPEIDDGPSAAPWLATSGSTGWLLAGGVLLAVIALVLVPAVVRRSRRWRRLASVTSGHNPIVHVWREILESAEDVGIVVAPTLTPRETAERLGRVRGMAGEGSEALHRIESAVERYGYGPRPEETMSQDARRALVADSRTVLACLASSVPRDERTRAFLLPPSLVGRTIRAVRRLA